MPSAGAGFLVIVLLAAVVTWKTGVFGGVRTTTVGLLGLAVMVPLLFEVIGVVATALRKKEVPAGRRKDDAENSHETNDDDGLNNKEGSSQRPRRQRQGRAQGVLPALSAWLKLPPALFEGVVVAAVVAFICGASDNSPPIHFGVR